MHDFLYNIIRGKFLKFSNRVIYAKIKIMIKYSGFSTEYDFRIYNKNPEI